MIKTYQLNDQTFDAVWRKGHGQKPVTPMHKIISDYPFLQINLIGGRGSGKTSAGLEMIIKNFMTVDTKLCVYSPSILNDEDNVLAISLLKEKYGDENIMLYKKFVTNGVNNFTREISEAEEVAKLPNESKYIYPRTIFFIDDCSYQELNSPDLEEFCNNFRHYQSLVILATQEWMHFPNHLRLGADITCIWRGIDQDRLKTIHKETGSIGSFRKFSEAYHEAVSGEPWNFLFIDKNKKQLRKSFNTGIDIKEI